MAVWQEKLKIFYGRNRHLLFIFLFAIVGSALLIFSFASPSQPSKVDKQVSKEQPDHAKKLGQLLFQGEQLQQAGVDIKNNPGKKNDLQPKLKAIAEARKNDLLELIKNDPKTARSLVLGQKVQEAYRESGLPVEQHVTLTGLYGFKQVDDEHGDHIYSLITTNEGHTYTINDDQALPQIKLGSTIQVVGHVLDDQLLLDARPGSEPGSRVAYASGQTDIESAATEPFTVIQSVAAATSTGEIHDAIMFGNFGGGDGTVDVERYKAIYNGTPGNDVASFVTENSKGKASLAADFYPVITNESIPCSDIGAQAQAMRTAQQAQNPTAQYTIYTYITNCPAYGSAGRSGSSPSTVYISSLYSLFPHAHEFAHAVAPVLLLGHGGYLACTPDVFVSPKTSTFDKGECVSSDYGDPFDVLGGNGVYHLSAVHKFALSWLDTTQSATIAAPGTTTYSLKSYALGDGLVAIKIPRGNSGSYFSVEYRQKQGFDTNICLGVTYCNVDQGALIHLGGIAYPGIGGGSDSNVLDTTPGSHVNPYGTWWPSVDQGDSVLVPGQTFTDSDYGISIKTLSADANGLNVEVKLASSCTRNPATITTPTPSLQTASPGQSKTYSITVTNNDSPGCGNAEYRFRPDDLYSGSSIFREEVTVTASPGYFSLAPGAAKTVVLTVSSTTNAQDGDYFSNPFGGSFYKMGHIDVSTLGSTAIVVTGGVYRLVSASDTVPPSAATNLTAKLLGSSAAELTWSPGTDNTGVVGYQIIVNNSSVFTTAESTFLLTGLLPSSAYTYTIKAFDHKNNASSVASGNFVTPAKTDTVPPGIVSNIRAQVSDHDLTVSWLKPRDNVGVAYYKPACAVFSCQVVPATKTSVTERSAAFYPHKNFTVYAYDGDGNVTIWENGSQPSIVFHTAMPDDTQAPTQPQQLYIQSASIDPSKGVVLTWQPSTDNTAIAGYYIYRGAARAAYVTSNNYTDFVPRSFAYRVQAVDTNGSLSPISNTFWVSNGGSNSDTIPPTATITNPASNATLSGTVNMQSSASDNNAVREVYYFIDGQLLDPFPTTPPYSYSLDTTKLADGPHWLVAEAKDTAGNIGTTGPINIVINNNNADLNAPTVNLTAPENDTTVSGIVGLTANATDNVGVTKVDFAVDGTVINSDTTSPYSFSWDSTSKTNGNHTISATASDAAGNTAGSSITVNVQNSDAQAPSTPTNLTATAHSPTQVNLSWAASTDNVGVTGYYVVRNGTTIAQPSGTSYDDMSAQPNATYSYQVMARDAAGNTSSLSAIANVTTPNPPDTSPPTKPEDLSATAISGSQINLSWTASTDNVAVAGYDIYRNGTKSATTTSTIYGDASLAASTTYSYFVIAKDAIGNNSTASETVSATTLAPPPPSIFGTIQGTTTSAGNPLPNVTVKINFGGANRSYTSSSTGVYVITGVPAGTYQVSYSKQGYTTVTRTVSVTANTTTTQNISLTKKGGRK